MFVYGFYMILHDFYKKCSEKCFWPLHIKVRIQNIHFPSTKEFWKPVFGPQTQFFHLHFSERSTGISNVRPDFLLYILLYCFHMSFYCFQVVFLFWNKILGKWKIFWLFSVVFNNIRYFWPLNIKVRL